MMSYFIQLNARKKVCGHCVGILLITVKCSWQLLLKSVNRSRLKVRIVRAGESVPAGDSTLNQKHGECEGSQHNAGSGNVEIVGKGSFQSCQEAICSQFLYYVSQSHSPSFPPPFKNAVAMEIPGFHKNRAVLRDQLFVSPTPPICILSIYTYSLARLPSTCCMSLIHANLY